MKKKIFASAVFLLLFIASAGAQDLNLAVNFLQGEKSKDSHSTEESFAISNYAVAYSVKYSGRNGQNRQDMEKTCTFTEQDIRNIVQTIVAKGLNVTDSLFRESSKTKSYEVYTNLSMAININGQEYKIKINGDTNDLDDSALYKNSVFFIAMLRNMVESCK